jgi:hypothetical protein
VTSIASTSTSTDHARDSLAKAVTAQTASKQVRYWHSRFQREYRYALKQENRAGRAEARSRRLLRELSKLRGRHPSANVNGVPAWFLRAILCIHRGEGAWDANTGNGFEGGLQFLNSTWLSSGGGRFAAHAYDATPAEQILVGYWLYKRSGFGPWPNTARACGVL